MYPLIRRAAAMLIAAAVVVLIVLDLSEPGFAGGWARHAVTTSLVTGLLIVAATALIFDEVVAYRQRKERSLAVAVQSLIVYGQAREAYEAVLANTTDPSAGNAVPDELRNLASNLLVASPSLFDDLDARDFLLQVNQLMALMFTAANGRIIRSGHQDHTEHLVSRMKQVQATFQPLANRFSPDYQQHIVDPDADTDEDTRHRELSAELTR